MTTISDYHAVANDLTRWQSITSKSPQVALETKYFKDNIGQATSIDALLKNRRLFNYAMKAFGLGDMTYAAGMMRKVLEKGVDNPRALAHTLNNPNILAFAKAFDFAGKGAGAVTSSTIDDVTGRFVEQALEARQSEQNPGVGLALYFRQKAPDITSIYGVLADKKLVQVVQTALEISPLTSAQQIDTQARLLKAKLNVADFQDPKKLDAFIARFSAMYDTQNGGGGIPAAVTSSNAVLYGASLVGSNGPAGVDFSLILRLQNAQRL